MGRMPISNRIASFQTLSCGGVSYGVLIFLSEGCSPVRARLHTRYAPVRRSPAKYCYFLLPLDLHVLGLSLAFILSQDQTLRCMTFFVLYLLGPIPFVLSRAFKAVPLWCYLIMSKNFYVLFVFRIAVAFQTCGCKGKNFFCFAPNLFSSFFSTGGWFCV